MRRGSGAGPRAAIVTGWMLAGLSGLALPVSGQGTKMKSVEPFLMDRAEEIALARSAGPRGVGEPWSRCPTWLGRQWRRGA
jgi:hypothetical protein